MPDIAAVLKQEISRLARIEIKAVADGHSKQIQALKATVRDLRDQVAILEKALYKSLAVASQRNSTPESEDDQRAIRISPSSIRKHRKRLRLSQAQLAVRRDPCRRSLKIPAGELKGICWSRRTDPRCCRRAENDDPKSVRTVAISPQRCAWVGGSAIPIPRRSLPPRSG
jgi:hypothetical protein